jgi:hypothetical protein
MRRMIVFSFIFIFLFSSGCINNDQGDSDKLTIIIHNGTEQDIIVYIEIGEYGHKVHPSIRFKESISFPANNSYNHVFNHSLKDASYIIYVEIYDSSNPIEYTISKDKLYSEEITEILIEYYYQSDSISEPDPQPRLGIWVNGVIS